MSILVYDEIWVREPRLMVPKLGPLGAVKINYTNALAQNILCLICSFGGVTRDMRSGERGVVFGSGTPAAYVGPYAGSIGAITSNVKTGHEFAGLASLPVGTAVTVAAVVNFGGLSAGWAGVISKRTYAEAEDNNIPFETRAVKDYTSGGTNVLHFATRSGGSWKIWHASNVIRGTGIETLSISHTYGAGTVTAYANGASYTLALTLDQGGTGIPAAASNKVRTSLTDTGTEVQGLTPQALYLAGAWNENWSAGKHAEFHRDPYQFLVPA